MTITHTILGVAAEAALEVPGITRLEPRLPHRLAATAAPTRTDTRTHHTPPQAGIRANRAPDGSGWHIQVHCALTEGRRALDVAQNLHDRVAAAVTSHLAALNTVEQVTVQVTVTRITTRHDAP
ncbi:hypothetical protein [Streptomyces sp. NPDC046759]|uniref:hypothetical protein n=1 Tax=Streptomyces sp. NPDC046759 TaxID=3155019 RepID=UPI0034002F1D